MAVKGALLWVGSRVQCKVLKNRQLASDMTAKAADLVATVVVIAKLLSEES
jgi:hypothetical protein